VLDVLEELGLKAAIAVPLRVRDDLIGLLAVYPAAGRELTENEEQLLRALAAQLAVAVQNARLHEETKLADEERKVALDAEREASRRLKALYEISRVFSESLSLDLTLEAVTRTIVETLDVDAASLRMPDGRGEVLEPVAMHVREERLAEPLKAILSLPQPLSPVRPNVFRSGRAILLDPRSAASLGPAHQPLVPFLEKGSTAAVIPLATQAEILGTLTLVSLDPDRPIDGATLDAGSSIAGQAALALDNARLYQQQKQFADSMQRSLLPRERPRVVGLDIGAVYASSARMDVGGDVYDFLELADGRLAVVLGDVTGHGIDAAADMAMAKFVFRSLAREHSEPGDFLAAANEIVLEEIGDGKFITLLYLTVDGREGRLACASAGHPPPRIVRAGGAPEPLAVKGLALGIAGSQHYEVQRIQLEPGDAAVLYTDGLLEARRDGELYGEERLDAALAANAGLPAEELAKLLVEDCRAFAGDLGDDCAVVVVKRV
jgi:serine phosphatase RsbU (regulator of sigma subunit)